jgi:hypothetical protein
MTKPGPRPSQRTESITRNGPTVYRSHMMPMHHPTAVVVDGRDGYTWSRGFDGALLNEDTATDMARRFNEERKPEFRTFKVYLLKPRFNE